MEGCFFLACAYREYGEHAKAAQTFEQAATNADSDRERLRTLMHAALQYAQAGLRPRSNKIVESLKREIDEKPDSRYELLIMLRDVAELDKNEALQIAVMEHIVELRPADIQPAIFASV